MNNNLGQNKIVLIVVVLVLSVLVLLPLAHYSEYVKAERLNLNGVVTHIQWKTTNHDLPLFQVKSKDGNIQEMNNGELQINPGQLAVGDLIIKNSGSRKCSVNGIEIECVRRYEYLAYAFFKEISSE